MALLDEQSFIIDFVELLLLSSVAKSHVRLAHDSLFLCSASRSCAQIDLPRLKEDGLLFELHEKVFESLEVILLILWAGREDCKLIAVEAINSVLFLAKSLLKEMGKTFEYLIANAKPIKVVDLTEAININERERGAGESRDIL